MVQRINGRLIFVYGCPKKEYQRLIKPNYRLSLLGILMGIFLLPNLAYLAAITPDNLIDLTNGERQKAGLIPLTANQLLTQAAIAKGQAIIQSQSFSHTIDNRKFSAWVRDTGYNYSYVGENLAIDFSSSEGVMQAWENSPLHKKNLLSPYYSEIGIAAIDGKFQGQDTTVVVQIFGAPAINSSPLLEENNLENFTSKINLSETANYLNQPGRTENLLTNSALKQELLPAYSNKLILDGNNVLSGQANKLFIQSTPGSAYENFMIIFSFLTLTYFLAFLYYHYFLKINRLISI